MRNYFLKKKFDNKLYHDFFRWRLRDTKNKIMNSMKPKTDEKIKEIEICYFDTE